eukprot:619265-Rhodomonas_salina.1
MCYIGAVKCVSLWEEISTDLVHPRHEGVHVHLPEELDLGVADTAFSAACIPRGAKLGMGVCRRYPKLSWGVWRGDASCLQQEGMRHTEIAISELIGPAT